MDGCSCISLSSTTSLFPFRHKAIWQIYRVRHFQEILVMRNRHNEIRRLDPFKNSMLNCLRTYIGIKYLWWIISWVRAHTIPYLLGWCNIKRVKSWLGSWDSSIFYVQIYKMGEKGKGREKGYVALWNTYLWQITLINLLSHDPYWWNIFVKFDRLLTDSSVLMRL